MWVHSPVHQLAVPAERISPASELLSHGRGRGRVARRVGLAVQPPSHVISRRGDILPSTAVDVTVTVTLRQHGWMRLVLFLRSCGMLLRRGHGGDETVRPVCQQQ